MYLDIEAAKQLGVSNAQIRSKVKRKGISEKVFKDLIKGRYTPKKPSDFFKRRINQINRNLNIETGESLVNPYIEARPFINEIIRQNRRIDLKTGELNIPDFDEPEETIDPLGTITTPPLTSPASINTQVVQSQNVGSTLPANFASLPTAQRAKIIEDFLRS